MARARADGAAASGEEPLARILVVDDNEANRDLLTRRLQRKGYVAESAEDGPQALEAITDGNYDLILLDVMMPGMSGIEVLGRLRADYNKTELPVIMATAKSESEAVVEALDGGANDYVTKPIDFKVLLARLQSHLATKKEAEERTRPTIDLSGGLPLGAIIDERYEILTRIGDGGFASVYRAKQLSTGQVVAFKYARPDRLRRDETGTELARFEQEMDLIGKLRHPNIVRLVDSGKIVARPAPPTPSQEAAEQPTRIGAEVDTMAEAGAPPSDISGTRPSEGAEAPPTVEDITQEVPYIVMEYLEGVTLAELLKKEGPLESDRTVELLLPVLSALGAAHDRGVVHRDVKPQNIILVRGQRGALEPRVLDFGIAKLTEPDAQALTVNESFIGTPEYMAPEQARGKKVDARADQFSVAAIFYLAVTGKKLYEAESFFAMVHAVASAEYEPPSRYADSLPDGLEEVLLRALAPERKERYRSVESFGCALLPFATAAVRRRWEDHFDVPSDPAPSGGADGWSTLDEDNKPLRGFIKPRTKRSGRQAADEEVESGAGDTKESVRIISASGADSVPSKVRIDVGADTVDVTLASPRPKSEEPESLAAKPQGPPWLWICLTVIVTIALAAVVLNK